jgi:hypothetical protein
MIIKVFSIILKKFINGFEDDGSVGAVASGSGYSYQTFNQPIILPFSQNDYPFSSGFFVIYDGDNSTDKNALTYEILENLGLKEKTDYMIFKEIVYFKTLEDRKLYDTIGKETYSCALAACNFKHLEKDEMGKITFVNENKFYITVRPKDRMEKELLKEVTLFFKSHGYAVEDSYFQQNFFSYENYSIKFYMKDEAMAAELGFYIEGKNLGIVLHQTTF